MLICAGIIFYPSLNILYLPSARRSTNHISYARKMAYTRKPTGRGIHRKREIAGGRRRSEKGKERPVTFISTSAVIYLQLGVWLKQLRIVNGGKGKERD